MNRTLVVEIRSQVGTVVERVDVSVLATNEAAVDMARRQAGITPDQFNHGQVIEG